VEEEDFPKKKAVSSATMKRKAMNDLETLKLIEETP
jgi:hypothetical protein